MIFSRLAPLVIAALLAGADGQIAGAACYEDFGCTAKDHFSIAKLERLTCPSLGFLRNAIFAEHGYCFHKAEYRELFTNRHCRFEESEDVPLTGMERANVRAIRRAERANDCPD
jgi:YARHG domain-containing protein